MAGHGAGYPEKRGWQLLSCEPFTAARRRSTPAAVSAAVRDSAY